MSAVAAPRKLADVNIVLAGSLVSMPKVMEGTSVWACDQELIWVKLKPKLMLCEPSVQLSVSLNCQTGALRRLGAVVLCALVMPAALMVRANPCWLATVPLKSAGLASGKKSTVPPVNPNRASLTRVEVRVERRAITFENRFEI